MKAKRNGRVSNRVNDRVFNEKVELRGGREESDAVVVATSLLHNKTSGGQRGGGGGGGEDTGCARVIYAEL